jgi:uncharacterized protein YkwD
LLLCVVVVAAAAPALAGLKAHATRRTHAPRRHHAVRRPHAARRAHAAQALAACGGADLEPGPGNAPAIGAATLCLVDRIRAADHLAPVRANRDLRSMAARKVRNMLRWNYFADIGPSGQGLLSLIGAARYRAHASRVSVGENIAWGTGIQATPASIVAGWMASPPHRKIILTRSYRDGGVAVIPAVPWRYGHGTQGATYAIELGTRR